MEEEMEEKIKKLKKEESVITYLEFLQNAISRMAGNSANIKALVAVIYTIFITILVGIEKYSPYWWIGLIIAVLGLIMDTYYLAFERMYRKKYNNFVDKLNEGKLDVKAMYDMNPRNTDLKYEVFAYMLESINSFSVTGFYILFVGITILLKFL